MGDCSRQRERSVPRARGSSKVVGEGTTGGGVAGGNQVNGEQWEMRLERKQGPSWFSLRVGRHWGFDRRVT